MHNRQRYQMWLKYAFLVFGLELVACQPAAADARTATASSKGANHNNNSYEFLPLWECHDMTKPPQLRAGWGLVEGSAPKVSTQAESSKSLEIIKEAILSKTTVEVDSFDNTAASRVDSEDDATINETQALASDEELAAQPDSEAVQGGEDKDFSKIASRFEEKNPKTMDYLHMWRCIDRTQAPEHHPVFVKRRRMGTDVQNEFAWARGGRSSQEANNAWNLQDRERVKKFNEVFEGLECEFPADLIKAIAWTESRWNHFNDDGTVVAGVNYKRHPNGFILINSRTGRKVVDSIDWGIMQINDRKSSLDPRIWDFRKIKGDVHYNIRAGIAVLRGKLEFARELKQSKNWPWIEDMYNLHGYTLLDIALKAYNGLQYSSCYVDQVKKALRNKPWQKYLHKDTLAKNIVSQ